MHGRSKKLFSVILALLLSAGIILFAWKGNLLTGNKVSIDTQGNIVASTDNSWKDALRVIPRDSKAFNSQNSVLNTTGTATTTTDILARDILLNYALAKQAGAPQDMSDADVQLFVETLAKKSSLGSEVKQYAQNDLQVVEATAATTEAYRKDLTQAINAFLSENTVNELVVVSQAVDSKDATKLKPLARAAQSYQKLIKNLLSIKTPHPSVDLHLYIIQSYATILSGVEDMQQIISDPTQGLSGMAKYHKGNEMLNQVTTLLAQKQ